MERDELIKQGIYLGKKIGYPKRSIKYFLENKREGEKVVYITSTNSEDYPGAFILTTTRVVFASKTIFKNSYFKEIPLEKIHTKVVKPGKMTYEMQLGSNHESMKVMSSKKEGHRIIEKINELQRSNEESTMLEDPISKLERLNSLKEKGIITAQEFEEKKSEILASKF
jgi:hypothetical protein